MAWSRMLKRVLTIIKKETLRFILLVLCACTIAVVYNHTRPEPMDWIREKDPGEDQHLSLTQVMSHIQNQSALFIDARSASEYAKGHLDGAYNISSTEKEFYFSDVKRQLKDASLIILYCTSSRCKQGEIVYRYLITQGISASKLRLYPGGWAVLESQKTVPMQIGEQP